MYCEGSDGDESSGTRVIEKAAFSSVTRSTFTATKGSDRIAGTIQPVYQSYKDATTGWLFASIVIDML